MSQIYDYLLTRQQEMVQMLQELVHLESPSDDRQAVNRVAARLSEDFTQLGARAQRLSQIAFGDHLRVEWGQGERKVLLLGHMDTVWPIGEAQERPFAVQGQRATGPGVFDMKGGIVIGYYALVALHELGLAPGCRLVFFFNSDEEWGSPTSRALIEEEAQRTDATLVLEPSREGALVVWRKGAGRFEIEVQGMASHAGAAHEQGVSAVKELAHQILDLEAMTDYGRGTTVSVGVVQGGSKVNVRPASAWAEIDVRVATEAEARRMTKAILGLRPHHREATLVLSGRMHRPPWEVSPQSQALFERAQEVGRRLGLDLDPAGAGGVSDGNFTAALGIPTLDGLGIVGDDAHALTEWADLASLPRRAALLAELLLDLGR
jgi:glutamate carboxypeptidase